MGKTNTTQQKKKKKQTRRNYAEVLKLLGKLPVVICVCVCIALQKWFSWVWLGFVHMQPISQAHASQFHNKYIAHNIRIKIIIIQDYKQFTVFIFTLLVQRPKWQSEWSKWQTVSFFVLLLPFLTLTHSRKNKYEWKFVFSMNCTNSETFFQYWDCCGWRQRHSRILCSNKNKTHTLRSFVLAD